MNAKKKRIDRTIALLTAVVMIPLLIPLRKSIPFFLSFSHLDGRCQSFTGSKQANGKKMEGAFLKKEKYFLRKFKWLGVSKKQRETIFYLYEKDIKKEIKSFGVPHGQKSPLFIKKKGYMQFAPDQYIINYKQIFQRNREYFPALTSALLLSSELLPGGDPLFEFLVFVQQIPFKLPPKFYEGRFINSFFTPLICLYEKYGDCDTKSLLLAEFLDTSKDAKGKVAIVLADYFGTSHSILAINRKPLPGMTTLYHPQKGYFIPLETSAPGWSPGFLSKNVTDLFQRGHVFFIDLN